MSGRMVVEVLECNYQPAHKWHLWGWRDFIVECPGRGYALETKRLSLWRRLLRRAAS